MIHLQTEPASIQTNTIVGDQTAAELAGYVRSSNKMKSRCYICFVSCLLISALHGHEIEVYKLNLKPISVSNQEIYPNVKFSEAQKQIVRIALYLRGVRMGRFQVANSIDALVEEALKIENASDGLGPFYQETAPYLVQLMETKKWYIFKYEFGPGIRFRIYGAESLGAVDKSTFFYCNTEPVTSFNKEVLDIFKAIHHNKTIKKEK